MKESELYQNIANFFRNMYTVALGANAQTTQHERQQKSKKIVSNVMNSYLVATGERPSAYVDVNQAELVALQTCASLFPDNLHMLLMDTDQSTALTTVLVLNPALLPRLDFIVLY